MPAGLGGLRNIVSSLLYTTGRQIDGVGEN